MLHKFMQYLLCATAVSTLSIASALPTGGGSGGDSKPPGWLMLNHPASNAWLGEMKDSSTSPPKKWVPPKPKSKSDDWIYMHTEDAAKNAYRHVREKDHGGKDWKGLVVTLNVPEVGLFAATKGSSSFLDKHRKEAPVWAKAAGKGKLGDAADMVLWAAEQVVEKREPGFLKERKAKGKHAYPAGTYMAAYGTLSGHKPDYTDPCLVPGSLRDTNRVCKDMLEDLGIDQSLDEDC